MSDDLFRDYSPVGSPDKNQSILSGAMKSRLDSISNHIDTSLFKPTEDSLFIRAGDIGGKNRLILTRTFQAASGIELRPDSYITNDGNVVKSIEGHTVIPRIRVSITDDGHVGKATEFFEPKNAAYPPEKIRYIGHIDDPGTAGKLSNDISDLKFRISGANWKTSQVPTHTGRAILRGIGRAAYSLLRKLAPLAPLAAVAGVVTAPNNAEATIRGYGALPGGVVVEEFNRVAERNVRGNTKVDPGILENAARMVGGVNMLVHDTLMGTTAPKATMHTTSTPMTISRGAFLSENNQAPVTNPPTNTPAGPTKAPN